MAVLPGERLAHYELLETLGAGGMGEVWRALDTRLGREVALKVLPEHLARDPGRLARFRREARAVAALNHPNIVTIHSVEEQDGVHFLTLELLPGTTLARCIPRAGMHLELFLQLAVPLSGAVGAAHERGILHRDLKPANIMVTGDGRVKVLDFGLARPRDAAGGEPLLPAPEPAGDSSLSGTLAYMSPEQIRGEALDHRSDIFSLGVVLYEMAAGRRPFPGESFEELAAGILNERPVPLSALRPDLPVELSLLVGRCLEKEPQRRTQSALDLRLALEDVLRGLQAPRPGGVPTVAVLPFADLSRERDQGYFCEGVAEEILNSLARVQGLQVASRMSSFRLHGTLLDSREIGQRLGVRHLLEGSVRKEGSRLRIAVQLTDAEGGFSEWSERYDRELHDVFAIQDEIARSVVRELEVTLSPGERHAIGRQATTHVQAYDYYLRGRKFFYHYGRRDIEFALQLFTRAIELDPAFALAHAGAADCWAYLYFYAERTEANRREADAASRRALELAPELAQAHASRGVALSLAGGDAGAEEAFETAIRMDPRLFEARYFYARHCFVRGQLEKSARLFEDAAVVRPEDFQSLLLVGQVYDALGLPEDAARVRRSGVAVVEEHLGHHPDDARALYMGANGLVCLGRREQGLRWLERAMGLEPLESMSLYNAGCIRSMAGQVEEAIACLEQAVDAGLAQRGWFDHDSNLDPLREHPRFKALMDRIPAAAPA
ncbi:MAG: protein kinase [Candidatus Eisenbacteria bacterium]|nr:protein kinase [Candidatus Eisenbacteria bacterium]